MADRRVSAGGAPGAESRSASGGDRGTGGDRATGGDRGSGGAPSRFTAALLLAGGLTGSVLLLVSQFLTLYNTHVAAQRAPVASGSVGGAHGYALVPIAVLAAFLTAGVYAALSRPSLLALGILGAVALVISLARDLPAAHREGVRLAAGHYVQAANTPAAGMYVETAGAVVLLITCVCGFILLGAPQPRPRSSGSPRPGGAPSRP